jgi:Amt family ammonium transporter
VSQIGLQLYGIVATVIWSAVASAVILFIIDKAIGLRVDHEDESQGLDLSQHGETVR